MGLPVTAPADSNTLRFPHLRIEQKREGVTMFRRVIALILALSLAMVSLPAGAQTIAPRDVLDRGNGGLGRLDDGGLQYRSPPPAVSIPNAGATTAEGIAHTLELKDDGTVWARGNNSYGQLGDGTTKDSSTAVQVTGPDGTGYLGDVIAIAAGGYHSLALRSDGTVWAWGYNVYGQLGDDTTTDRRTPVQVKGPDGNGYLTNVTAIAAGPYHNLARKSDGTVWAWGRNFDGQLGDGTKTDRRTPVQVKGPDGYGYLTNVIAISTGPADSFAQKSDGTVWGWGRASFSWLGDNHRPDSTTPILVGKGFVATAPWDQDLDPADDPLVASDDRYAVLAGKTLGVAAPGVLVNDSHSNASVQPITGPARGTLTLNSDGSFIYTPVQGFSGVDQFSYRAVLGPYAATATVSIQVLGPRSKCVGCDLPSAGLSGGDLSGANLTRANLSVANLGQTNLNRANLNGADLSMATLAGASLRRANLSQANLAAANLAGADLSGANLSGAILGWTNLTDASLSRANLSGANLVRANLTGANLNQANLSRAIWDDTTCPDGSNSDQNGGSCVNH